MFSFFHWYLIITAIGWLVFPLGFRLLPALADRGYTLCRTLGLLLWGYIFWLLASLGFLGNDGGGLLFALIILLVLSIWSLQSTGWHEFYAWLRGRWKFILQVELLFLLAFASMALVRAANPEILGTEKPMELAFINAILRSPTFPPHDPWLSGYAISYYYFGYIMVAMLAKMSAVPGNIAFNLGISLVFALSAMGSYGLVYNLLARTYRDKPVSAGVLSLLSPLFILLIGNLEGVLEVLHGRGLFWKVGTNGEWTSSFWKWLDLVELVQPPSQPLSLQPSRYYWWWRASRVVQDYDLQGNLKEVINEFPSFSYLLADLHPHVLAMPFAFLAMALALNMFLGGGQGYIDKLRARVCYRWLIWIWVVLVAGGILLLRLGMESMSIKLGFIGLGGLALAILLFTYLLSAISQYGIRIFWQSDTGDMKIGKPLYVNLSFLLLVVVTLGGLGFLNTWDFPFYVALFAGAYTWIRWQNNSRGEIPDNNLTNPIPFIRVFTDFLWIAFVVGLLGIVVYLPFYISFSSQVGGILPNLIYPTRGTHFWIMFAPLLLPLGGFLVYLLHKDKIPLGRSFRISAVSCLALWSLSILIGLFIISLPEAGSHYLGSLAASNAPMVYNQALNRHLINTGGWISFILIFGTVLSLLGARPSIKTPQAPLSNSSLPAPHTFIFLMIMLGIVLAFGPEFFFLQDQFGWRINTIFKFYYQGWLLWGIAAAYGTAILLTELRGLVAAFHKFGLIILLGMGLTYTIFGLFNKTNGFSPIDGWTLDGTRYLERQSPDEMAAIRWLQAISPGVVAEAVSSTGGSYTHYGRVAMLSGLPSVLGWMGHESQWRGGGKEMGTRQNDLERLYCSRDWEDAQQVLNQYAIRYVFVGSLERSTYTPKKGSCTVGVYEAKFSRNLEVVFEQGETMIYMVR